jgi:hypothetical protein
MAQIGAARLPQPEPLRHPLIGAQVGADQGLAADHDETGRAVLQPGVGHLRARDRESPSAVEPQPVALDEVDQPAGRVCGPRHEHRELVSGAAGQDAAVHVSRVRR